MTKKALLFGLNYVNDSSAALAGCVNDAIHLRNLLTQKMGFTDKDIMLCTDHTPMKPTKAVMLKLIHDLVMWTHRQYVDSIFISYSGHGTSVQDATSDELDGKDEALVPLDYKTNGVIVDDELSALIKKVHPRTDVVILVDACHSGTIMDFPYRYISGDKRTIESKVDIPCRAVMISGCRDHQLSQEVWSFADDKKITGLMTASFIHALEVHGYNVTCWKLIKYMKDRITEMGFAQRPQMSTSRRLDETTAFIKTDKDTRPFMWHDQ